MTCFMSLGVTRESTRAVHVDVFELQAVSFIMDMHASGIKKIFPVYQGSLLLAHGETLEVSSQR